MASSMIQKYTWSSLGVFACVSGFLVPWWPLCVGGVLLLAVSGSWFLMTLVAFSVDLLWGSNIFGYQVPICALSAMAVLWVRHYVMSRVMSKMPESL